MKQTVAATREGPAPTEFAEALRVAIAHSGLSLDALRNRLLANGHQISVATLSYWRAGRRHPERAASLAALTDLEGVLGLPRGTLTNLAGGTRAVPPPEEDDDPGPMLPFAPLINALDLRLDDGLLRQSIHDVAEVDADGAPLRATTRVLVQATRPGVTRFPMTARSEAGSSPTIRPLFGFHLGRSASSDDGLSTAYEAVLDRPLPVGESMLLEYETRPGTTRGGSLTWERWFVRPLPLYLLRLTFPGERIPTTVERTTRPLGGGGARSTPVLVLSRTVTEVFTDVGPGLAGLTWTW